MLEKLSGDAVEPDQLARLHDIGLSQPLRPAQGPAGAEVEWWKLGSMVLGRACIFRASLLWYVVFFSMAVDEIISSSTAVCVAKLLGKESTLLQQ